MSIKRLVFWLGVSLAGILIPEFALAAQLSRTEAKCQKDWPNPLEADRVIAACTALMQSDKQPKAVLISTLIARGNVYLRKGQADLAISDYDAVLKINPKSSLGYLDRGAAYLYKLDYERAVNDCSEALKLQPNFIEAYMCKGWAYLENGNPDDAIANFSIILQLNDKDLATIFARGARGESYFVKGDYDRAIADFDQAIKEQKKVASLFLRRGDAHREKKDFEHATYDYNEAIAIAPAYGTVGEYDHLGGVPTDKSDLDVKYALAFKNMGNQIYADDGAGSDGALRAYNEAIRINPKYAAAYNNRGNVYATKGRYDKAMADYNEAIKLAPSFAFAINGRGNTYLRLGEHDKAIADYDAALALNPHLATALYPRGIAKQRKGDGDGAAHDKAAAVAIDPAIAARFSDYSDK